MKKTLKLIALLLATTTLFACNIIKERSIDVCAKDGCNNPPAYGSIYCDEHKRFKDNDTTNVNNYTAFAPETTTETTTEPLVVYSDIKKGSYNNKTVKIEGIVGDIKSDSVSIKLDTWFNYNNMLKYNEFLLVTGNDDNLCNYVKTNVKTGNSCIFTVQVYEDASNGTSFGSLTDIKVLDKELITSDKIKQMYISGCANIPAVDLARSPEQYAYKTDIIFTGKVFQLVNEYDNSVQFLLDTGGENGIVNVYYDRPEGSLRILENDNITIYGTFTHMYDYTSVLGSGKSIPSIVCRFID